MEPTREIPELHINQRRVIVDSDEKELVKIILGYAHDRKMTALNIREAVEKAIDYMNNNAILETGDSE